MTCGQVGGEGIGLFILQVLLASEQAIAIRLVQMKGMNVAKNGMCKIKWGEMLMSSLLKCCQDGSWISDEKRKGKNTPQCEFTN